MEINLPMTLTTRSAGELPISMPLPEPSEPADQTPSWFRTCWRMLHPVNVAILLAVYASLIGLLQLKFQKESAFETHTLFMIISVVAIFTFVLTYWILDHTNEDSIANHDQLSSPSIQHMILASVALFSMVVALVSLLLVLLVPPMLMWIGDSIICLLILPIIAYISIHHLTPLGKKLYTAISELVNCIRNKF